MRWLVTGGAGFIGSNFIRVALAAHPSLEITNLDLLTYAGRRENLLDLEASDRYRFVHGDVCRASDVGAALAPSKSAIADAIIHMAAESHVDRSIADASSFIRTNVQGTQVVLEAARRYNVQRFLHVSTDEVYGSLGHQGRFREDSPLAPNSPYAASKAAGDLLVRAAFHTFATPVVSARASNNFGPLQYPEKLIPLAIANALEDRAIPLYGNGENVRNWIHVEDHCRGLLAALEHGKPGAIYNLGGDSEISNRKLLEALLDLMGKPRSLIQLVADRPGHDFRYALDSSRAHQELHWRPEVALADGLRTTVEWYRSHPEWVASVRDEQYKDYYQRQYGTPASHPAGSSNL